MERTTPEQVSGSWASLYGPPVIEYRYYVPAPGQFYDDRWD